jgi:hypothetical protein
VGVLVGQLHNLEIPQHELTQMQYQQLLQQLDNITASMTTLIKLEHWQLHTDSQIMPMTSLVKRAIEKVENCLQQKKLWIGVHGLGEQVVDQLSERGFSRLQYSSEELKCENIAIIGDISKIELVLYELLFIACARSTSGGRIDVWCRRLDERLTEISITDNGIIEPQMLVDLRQQTHQDVLIPSTLDQPPGLHLLICQNLMQQLGGAMHLYQLPDGRVVSILLLPLAGRS